MIDGKVSIFSYGMRHELMSHVVANMLFFPVVASASVFSGKPGTSHTLCPVRLHVLSCCVLPAVSLNFRVDIPPLPLFMSPSLFTHSATTEAISDP